MAVPEVNNDAVMTETAVAAGKPKRVRTGCLTCRERHLKCDEGLPCCLNCKKSNRTCKRGLRLNFIDTQVQEPPIILTSTDWKIQFSDESREIASEYKGGLARYGTRTEEAVEDLSTSALVQTDSNTASYDYGSGAPPAPSMSYQELPPMQSILPGNYNDAQSHLHNSQTEVKFNPPPQQQHYHQHAQSNSHSPFSTTQTAPDSHADYTHHDQSLDASDERREYLNTQEEVLFMQVFVEEVGIWMDSMDPMKHFSRLLPFHSLQEPMLVNAFLACGARHLTLVNPNYSEEKALNYYDTATRYLLKNLQDPNRDTVICATTAVILNVYEIMSERALQRMNHIAGARALIKECGWNARASGIGAACFWLNVGLEVLSCLHFNWQVAWDPDDWGIDMDFTREVNNCREEIWTHRMLYIVAKVCNFRATIPRFQESDPRDEDLRRHNRYAEWQRLKDLADAWNDSIPRTMHPMAYLYPYQTTSKSAFPEVWLVKRTTIVARLFYHTVMVLMAQIHPYLAPDTGDMHELQTRHSQMICGITAHVKDRGVASVALRSLAHAAECLTDRREQEEVLQIFTKINKETGWRINFVFKELKEKWGWPADDPSANHEHRPSQNVLSTAPAPQANMSQSHSSMQGFGNYHNLPAPFAQPAAVSAPPPTSSTSSAAPAPYRRPPSGIVNPMFAAADFSKPQHPYQNVYVAPNHAGVPQHSTGLYY